jgi:arylsulfatase A-like enzyme
VLLIVLESVAERYLGYAGGPASLSPSIDALAKDSLRMRRTWTTATHSNYAQMAILSSLFPRRGLGLDTYDRLDYPRVLLHDVAHAHGYATATISSQDESWQGMARFQDTGTPTTFVDARAPGRARVDIGTEKIAADHETATRAIEWMQRQRGRWSLYVNFQSTHFPYALPRGVRRPYRPHAADSSELKYLSYPSSLRSVAINRYKNALAYVDHQVGRLVQWLRASGQLDDTLIVLTSDHGELFFEHGLVTHGRTLFEEEARVPLLLHWPGRIEPQASRRPSSTLDVLPTIVDAMGLPPHPAHQGRSLLPASANDSPKSDAAASPGLLEPRQADRAVLLNIQGLRGVEGVVCWPYKLTRDWSSGRLSLYDLATDPGERRNRATDRPEQAQALRGLLQDFMLAQDDYHREEGVVRLQRFAPPIPRCPSFGEPARSRANAAVKPARAVRPRTEALHSAE